MIAGILFSLVLGVAGVIYGNKFLQQQSDKLLDLKLQYRVPEENQTALKHAKTDIQKYTQLGQTAKSVVPQEKDQARTVREIISYAAQTYDPNSKSGIQILSITFPSSNLGQATTSPGVTPPVSSGAKTDGAVTPKVIAPPVSQVLPVIGIPGVYVQPVTVESDPAHPVTFNQILQFLSLLEQNRRTAQVNQIAITPQKSAASGEGLSFTLTVNVYINP